MKAWAFIAWAFAEATVVIGAIGGAVYLLTHDHPVAGGWLCAAAVIGVIFYGPAEGVQKMIRGLDAP